MCAIPVSYNTIPDQSLPFPYYLHATSTMNQREMWDHFLPSSQCIIITLLYNSFSHTVLPYCVIASGPSYRKSCSLGHVMITKEGYVAKTHTCLVSPHPSTFSTPNPRRGAV